MDFSFDRQNASRYVGGMFGLSGEHLLILAGILLIFGPRKLPELGASVGKALRNFKEGLNQPPSINPPQNQAQISKTDSAPKQEISS
jgi:sec-independent protein translocase protein TatA